MLAARSFSSFLAAITLTASVSCAVAQTQASAVPPAKSKVVKPVVEGPRWSSLNFSQQNALRPLERDWDSIDSSRKDKWVEVANRFPNMSPEERARVQTRMSEWAKLTPRERGQARMNYKEAQQLSPQERKARWEAYNALAPEQRQQFADRAAPASQSGRKATHGDTGASAPTQKSNVVPNTSFGPRPRPVAPSVAQAQPGATTNLINKRPAPPVHQQAGMPKIAATPSFVDQKTLLPKRGPQGAATRPAASSAASAPPQKPRP